MAKIDKSGIQDHPLFPFEDDEEPKEIAFIQVIRHEDGRSKQVPRMFRADELQSLQDIHALFGGGLYELWGRGRSINDPQRCGRIASVRRYEIAGISKPLVDDGSNAATVNSTPINYVPPVAPAGQATPDTSVMGMFMQMQMAMMQQSQETARQQAEAQRRADERSRADSQQMMQMIATMQAQSTQSMMGVVTAMVSSSRGGGGAEDMGKYVELFGKMGLIAKPGGEVSGDGEGGGIGTILSDLADVVQGAVQLKESGGLGGIVPPPGSAAALFGVKPPGSGGVPPAAP